MRQRRRTQQRTTRPILSLAEGIDQLPARNELPYLQHFYFFLLFRSFLKMVVCTDLISLNELTHTEPHLFHDKKKHVLSFYSQKQQHLGRLL